MAPHTEGLQHDLEAMARQAARRKTLSWLGALGMVGTLPLVGCGGGGSSADTTTSSGDSTSSDSSSGSSSSSGTCSVIPEETAGPYPGDGSNTSSGTVVNALALSGIVRSNITSSVGGISGTATGVPLTVVLTLKNASCSTLEGYAIYLWHCTSDGNYSLYSSGYTGQNYLRGVQATDASGQATFETIFPGCYLGRMPHMHFEIYRSLTTATSYSNKLATSQLAFPRDICEHVYDNASGYGNSASNLAQISFATDNVFSDGYTLEMTSLTGDITNGYTATITVSISV